MAKLQRFLHENMGYHVVSTTRGRRAVFRHTANAEILVAVLQNLRSRAFLLAYAVMPDHVHAILYPRPGHTISALMQSLKGYSSRQINLLSGDRGPIWQQSFFDRMIRDERHLFETIDYIQLNPVVAGYVDVPGAYPYSSACRSQLTDVAQFYGDILTDAEARKPRLQELAKATSRPAVR